ncbi:MAG: lysostaphin resistance A-like protein [Halanaeroarchaeum sp.]
MSRRKGPKTGDERPASAVAGALLVATGGMAGAFVVTFGMAVGVRLFDVSLSPVASFVLTLASGATGFVAVALLYHRSRPVDLVTYVGIGFPSLRDVAVVVLGYVGTMSLLIASGIVVTTLGIEADTANRAAQRAFERPILLLWLVPLSFFVIAPGEELLFRGTVQNRLREAFPAVVAIPATAALFAVLHFFSLTGGAGGRFVAIAVLFFPSLVFGAVYEYTENITTSILVHGAYNSTLALAGYVALRGFPREELALLV